MSRRTEAQSKWEPATDGLTDKRWVERHTGSDVRLVSVSLFGTGNQNLARRKLLHTFTTADRAEPSSQYSPSEHHEIKSQRMNQVWLMWVWVHRRRGRGRPCLSTRPLCPSVLLYSHAGKPKGGRGQTVWQMDRMIGPLAPFVQSLPFLSHDCHYK